MHIRDLEHKKVAVWGAGREGQSVLRLLQRHFPGKPLTVLSDQPLPKDVAGALAEHPEITLVTGDKIQAALQQSAVVVKSPGVSLYRPEITAAKAAGVAFTSGTSLWFAEHQSERVVAVTGTKGKSTTTALIGHLLQQSGLKTVVAGNIGRPLLDSYAVTPAPDVWVLELSSYQIADLDASPDIAVLVDLYISHIEWHRTLEQYYADKLNLFTRIKPTGASVINRQDAVTMQQKVNWINPVYYNDQAGIHLERDSICSGSQELFPSAGIPLLGRHNFSNLCAALTVMQLLHQDIRAANLLLQTFQPLPHRLQVLGEHDGVRFINDSIATVPESCMAAVEALNGANTTLILGGQDLKTDWTALADFIVTSSVRTVITLPDTSASITAALQSAGRPNGLQLESAPDLTVAVSTARRLTPSGGVVLLSPACPSYGRYRNFEERGQKFAEAAGFPFSAASIRSGAIR